MKHHLTLLFVTIISVSLHAQKTVWAKTISNQVSKVSNYHKIETDKDNNFYVMANFSDNINFGTISLDSKGKSDVFIAKIDADGENIEWGIGITGVGFIEGKSITIDKDNNVYIAGSMEGEADFGTITIKPKHHYAFFIAKYNSSGVCQWVKQGGNYDSKWPYPSAFAYAVETDNEGNVYASANVLAMYDDWKDDPSLPLEDRYLGKIYYEDEVMQGKEIFTGNHSIVVKLNPSTGDLIWKRVGPMNLSLLDFVIDDKGCTYFTGAIGGKSLMEGKDLEANGLSDIIILKLDQDGKTAWLKQYGVGEPYLSSGAYATNPAKDIEAGQFIEMDGSGNLYITGMHFDGAKFDDVILSSNANIKGLEVGNAFLAKLDQDVAPTICSAIPK